MARESSSPSSESPAHDRRKFRGWVVHRQVQFRLALICSSLILLPSLIVAVTIIANWAIAGGTLAQAGAPPAEITRTLVARALNGGMIIIAVFAISAAISVLISLKLSNHMVGPVNLLENQVREMLNGNFAARRELRKGDYLIELGEQLNSLATKIRSEGPSHS